MNKTDITTSVLHDKTEIALGHRTAKDKLWSLNLTFVWVKALFFFTISYYLADQTYLCMHLLPK